MTDQQQPAPDPNCSKCQGCGRINAYFGDVDCNCVQPAPDPPKQVRCWRCEDPATREFCEPAEPWVPYCPKHPNHNGTAGNRKLIVHPKPDALFTAWVWRKEGDPK